MIRPRIVLAGCAVTLLVGCVLPGPISFRGVIPAEVTPDELFDCAYAQLNLMDYNLVDVDRDSRFARAQRQVTDADWTERLSRVLSAEMHNYDVITVTVFVNPSTNQAELRAVADSRVEGLEGSEDTEAAGPSELAVADARSLISACSITADGEAGAL